VYQERLKGCVKVPKVRSHNESVWAQFTACSSSRDSIIEHLKAKNIPTAIHYPIPLHAQEVFSPMRLRDKDFPVSTRVSNEVFSLPMHPFLPDADVDHICRAVIEASK
jgi:UDP-2-acetamido-2-deoxy-ribo-hexuluronate aminotransferase